jgi:hypothetical protein
MAKTTHDDHGNTVASWTCVGLLILASFVMSMAVVLASIPAFVGGGVLAVIAVVTGKVLQLAGYGRSVVRSQSDQTHPDQAHPDQAQSDQTLTR